MCGGAPRIRLCHEYFHADLRLFLFERDSARRLSTLGPDNSSTIPTFPSNEHVARPATPQRAPDYIDATLGHLPDDTLRKILHDNAARLYGVD